MNSAVFTSTVNPIGSSIADAWSIYNLKTQQCVPYRALLKVHTPSDTWLHLILENTVFFCGGVHVGLALTKDSGRMQSSQ